MIDQTISHFRIVEKLGAGGMGVVYKAVDLRLERPVALKFLPDNMAKDAQALERFRREARAASALNHPGICTIYDIGEQDGRAFIAMEFLDGENLRNYIHGRPCLLEETLKLGIQIAEALDAAHSEGIIHRDLKPANVFVTRRGQAKILDLGLAKIAPKGFGKAQGDSGGDAGMQVSGDSTRGGSDPLSSESADPTSIVGIISGTPSYMSPEQVRGDNLDPRTDIFSLGLLLYEMATGRQAFSGKSGGAIIEAVLTRTPVSARSINPDVPPELEQIIDKALHKDREQRYRHAADLRAELLRLERRADSGRLEPRENTATATVANPAADDSQPSSQHTVRNVRTQSGKLRAVRISKTIDSLAVLPFENASRDPENEYLSDGIAGSLINSLATIPKLRVMAQSTVFRYKGRPTDAQSAGREMNVRAVLTGRIMQSGGSLRIGAELVDVLTGSQLWGAQYDRKPGDIIAVQDEISNEISDKLRLKLTRAEKKRLSNRQTADPEAYRLYLKGRHHWNQWTEDGFYKAIEYFQAAVEKDPTYALAYTGIADSYVLLGWNSYLPPKDAFPKGKIAAMRALRLDADLGEAHTPVSAVYWLHDWEWQEAEAEFKRSMALSPNHPTASHWFAEFLMTMGRHEEALARFKKSQELDPLSLIISSGYGWSFYHARRYDEAIAQLRRTIELEEHYPIAYWVLGLVFRKMGDYQRAVAEGEMAVKLTGGSPLMRAALAQTLATAGRKTEAREILSDLTNFAKGKYVAPYFFAGVYVGLEEHDAAVEYLEKAYEERSHWLLYLHIDPAMDALRSDTRFQSLLQRIGLPLR
jgi:serine/threonine protein kinase/tetratricopeptide (TPR) repeat protein